MNQQIADLQKVIDMAQTMYPTHRFEYHDDYVGVDEIVCWWNILDPFDDIHKASIVVYENYGRIVKMSMYVHSCFFVGAPENEKLHTMTAPAVPNSMVKMIGHYITINLRRRILEHEPDAQEWYSRFIESTALLKEMRGKKRRYTQKKGRYNG